MLMNSIKDIIRRLTGEVPTKTLIKRGMKVGKNFNRQQGCFLDPTHCWLIEIGDNVVMSIRVVLLAHDASSKPLVGYTKLGRIVIGDNVFFGANSMVMPGVTIGKDSIIGANSVVTKDVPDGVVMAGCPARVICSVDDYKMKMDNLKGSKAPVFEKQYMYGSITNKMKEEMKEKLRNSNGFIV